MSGHPNDTTTAGRQQPSSRKGSEPVILTATTKSGAKYIIEDRRWSYRGTDAPLYSLTIESMKTFSQAQAVKHAADGPKVGKRLYIRGNSDWRVSSEVVSVEKT